MKEINDNQLALKKKVRKLIKDENYCDNIQFEHLKRVRKWANEERKLSKWSVKFKLFYCSLYVL